VAEPDSPPYSTRPVLRAVETEDSVAPSNVSTMVGSEQAGPPRLQITMEETTDEAADRRRLRRVLDVLTRNNGELLAELCLTLRGGAVERLRLPGVADIESVIPELQPILGVLGTARRAGDPAYERAYAAAAG